MKKNLILFILANICIFNQKAAEPSHLVYSDSIIKIDSFKEVDELLYNVAEDTLVLFDIDETLIEPANMICKDQFQDQFQELYEKNLLSEKLSDYGHKALDKKKIIEPIIKDIIHQLQAKKVTVLGLTSRYAENSNENYTAKSVYSDLYDLGIDFHNYKFKNFNITDVQQLGGDIRFYNGIIFTGATHKGYALFSFLNHIGLRPKKIIFFDDVCQHLIGIKAIIDSVNINNQKKGWHQFEFYGYHYNYVKNSKNVLDEEVVDFQMGFASHYGEWVDDKIAQEIIESDKNNQLINSFTNH